jgi:hypothetical protein
MAADSALCIASEVSREGGPRAPPKGLGKREYAANVMTLAADKAGILTQIPPTKVSLCCGEYAFLFATATHCIPEPYRLTCKNAAIKLLEDFHQV